MTREIIYTGKKITLALDRRLIADGSLLERAVVLHPGAVVIIPLLDAEHVCLVRNFRFSVEETLLELPAGTLEPPEPPEVAGVRELAEETGYRAARWTRIAAFYPSPGIMNERMYLYVAEGLTPGPQKLEAGEEIRTEVWAWKDAVAAVLDGTIRDSKTMVGILLWDRLRSEKNPR
jgi:ADP-ribose pyrophosphatase